MSSPIVMLIARFRPSYCTRGYMIIYIRALTADGLCVLLDIHSQKSPCEFDHWNLILPFLFKTWKQSHKWTKGFEEVALGFEAMSWQVTWIQPVKIAGLWHVIFLFMSFRPVRLIPDSHPERISVDLERRCASCSEGGGFGRSSFFFFCYR